MRSPDARSGTAQIAELEGFENECSEHMTCPKTKLMFMVDDTTMVVKVHANFRRTDIVPIKHRGIVLNYESFETQLPSLDLHVIGP